MSRPQSLLKACGAVQQAAKRYLPRSDSSVFGAGGPAEFGRTRGVKPTWGTIDIAIAACALAHNAALWTLNPADFKDIPDLQLL
jgi:predicted nucleic acid-binding protein